MYVPGDYLLYKEPMNLRSEPDKDAPIIDILPQGICVCVEETKQNWGKITYSGKQGWCCISKCFAKLLPDFEREDTLNYYALKSECEQLRSTIERIRKILH